MKIPLYWIDAFTGKLFAGNPAAVCPLEAWLDDRLLQAIAAENNVSETAFLLREDGGFHIRWFTPVSEVELCGHATLAAAHVVHRHLQPGLARITFRSLSGPLTVDVAGELHTLDFPARPGVSTDPAPLEQALRCRPVEAYAAREDDLAVYDSEETVRALAPDFEAVVALGRRGVIATAPGRDVDFVSRYFAPAFGIPEDPVTGSAHCTLTPYWSQRLGKRRLTAHQLSERGGELWCEDRGERIGIGGRAVQYLCGVIELDDARA